MSENFIVEEGPERYAVEYIVRGEAYWRRTMELRKEDLDGQEDVLLENRSIAATRQVVITECVRLLRSATRTAISDFKEPLEDWVNGE